MRCLKSCNIAFCILTLLLFTCTSQADPSRLNQPTLSINNQQIFIDGQIYLGMTPTIESALHHGISIVYVIDIQLTDPQKTIWHSPLAQKKTRVKLAYDSLKQTYLLTNLNLQRFNTDRDLKRALITLGAIQSLPIISTAQLTTNQSYTLKIRVEIERDSLPNALRLSSIIDSEWQVGMGWKSFDWKYQP